MSLIVSGEVDPVVLTEFPGLGIVSVRLTAQPGRTPVGVQQELAMAAERINGPTAVRAAGRPAAAACRAFRAELGMNPAEGLGSLEDVMRRRLIEGGFREAGMPSDAMALATLETGVALLEAPADSGAPPSIGTTGDGSVVSLINKRGDQVWVTAVVAPGISSELAVLTLERVRDLCEG